MGTYIQDHPTHYNWRPDVRALVAKYRNEFPNATFNTYWWHPPYNPPTITRRFDAVSFDVWGKGGRGSPIPHRLGERVFWRIFNDPALPRLYWTIWDHDMWVIGSGWEPAPPGPPDSDPDHTQHIHCTFI